ncbi:site-2 protease family protein [Cellulomonas sp. JH27-2]|uniref:site-2 protease family protein n=1 Tax=Cellulomonas sp. JH27-2 TaxID=2774139 RepID=UPI001782D411|nr:site-2 protease family protein [Cellulomonas sp. JH27-2]MBD8058954.1 site-2 protease family protein [Cellulomonas sp. JH27-2]
MSTPRPPARRTQGWVIGRVVGAPVILAPSWLIAAVVLTLVFAPSVRARSDASSPVVYAVAAAFVVLLFGSVLVHELAHGLVARARGQQPHEFVLTLWGGHTSFGGGAPTPATSALVAAVGPFANLVLAVAFLGAAHLVDPWSVGGLLLYSGAISNGFVAVFNMIPGLPLDGGRVLEAAVWAATKNRHTGTVAAGWVGRIFAVLLFAWALAWPLVRGVQPDLVNVVWTAFIAAFLWAGATASVRSGKTEKAVHHLTLGAIATPAVGVPHDDSVAHAGATAAGVGAQEVVLLSPDGRPAAYVDRSAAAAVPHVAAGSTPLSSVAVTLPVGSTVDGTLTGQALVQAIGAATRTSPVVVAMVDGRVVGLIRATDVIAAIRA